MPSKKLGTRAVSADVKSSPGNRWVGMSNGLTRAGHGLSLSEKRLVACAVSTIDSRRPLALGEVLRSRVTAAEYAETFGIDANTAYDQLQAAAKNLYNRSITFYEAAHRRGGKPLQPTVVTQRWVSRADYQKGEGWVALTWSADLVPHLTGLRKQFTTYQLQQTSALRTASSWKLLELLMRFESTGWAEYTIEDFCTSMEATEKQRADFGKVRTKIIEPAVRELVEKDNWLIQWQPVKAGRKVSAVRFEFERNPQGKLL